MGIVVTLVLSGCSGHEPGHFPIPADEAYRRLISGNFDDFRFNRQCGILIHIKPYGVAGRSVVWLVHSSGREVLRFTAHLTPISAGETKVDLEIPRLSGGGEAYDGTQFYRRPTVQQPTRPAIEEKIASLLEGRKYDPSRIPRPERKDSVCLVQRGGLESGSFRFRVDDPPEMDPRG